MACGSCRARSAGRPRGRRRASARRPGSRAGARPCDLPGFGADAARQGHVVGNESGQIVRFAGGEPGGAEPQDRVRQALEGLAAAFDGGPGCASGEVDRDEAGRRAAVLRRRSRGAGAPRRRGRGSGRRARPAAAGRRAPAGSPPRAAPPRWRSRRGAARARCRAPWPWRGRRGVP